MRRIAALWRNRRDDKGFSLTEVLVSTSIMAVVMVLVTGGVIMASKTSARVDAAGTAQAQIHNAFDKLDRQVRWASAFSAPGQVGTTYYVEWVYSASGTATCNQLRLDTKTQQLSQRSWPQATYASATAWKVLASRVATEAGVSAPFTTDTTAGFSAQRLKIALTATGGGAKLTDTVTHDVTYTALNSNASTTATTACTIGRPTS